MAEYLIQDTTLDAIADAIHAKSGAPTPMTPEQMVTEIGNIPSGGGGYAAPTMEQFVVYMLKDGAYVDITGEGQFFNPEIENWLSSGMPIKGVKLTNVYGNECEVNEFTTTPVSPVVYGANTPSLILGNNKVYMFAGVKIGLSTKAVINSASDCLAHDLAPVELTTSAVHGNYYFNYKGRRINQYKHKVTNPTANDVVINSVYFVVTISDFSFGTFSMGVPDAPNGTERID